MREPGSLAEAHVAAFFRQDRLVKPGVRDDAHRILDAAGLMRHAGPGTLELAWVAAGRLDAWIQPDDRPLGLVPGRAAGDRGRRHRHGVERGDALARRRLVSAWLTSWSR